MKKKIAKELIKVAKLLISTDAGDKEKKKKSQKQLKEFQKTLKDIKKRLKSGKVEDHDKAMITNTVKMGKKNFTKKAKDVGMIQEHIIKIWTEIAIVAKKFKKELKW